MSENTQNTQQQVVKHKDITAPILTKLDRKISNGLELPPNYNAANALEDAYYTLLEDKNKPLEKCSEISIQKALYNMVQKGLSLSKNQCYFIPYGDGLKLSISYIGNIALAKRLGGVKTIKGQVIYKGDDFRYQINPKSGRKEIIHHNQTLESLGSDEIIAAYAIAEFNDGTHDIEIMTMPQIRKSWEQGAMKGNSPAHKNFPDQMAIKTVINRLTKVINGSSDDSYLNEDASVTPQEAEIKQEIQTKANSEPLDFEDAEVIQAEVVDVETGELFPNEPNFA